jgi:Acetyltransferase (GNAT) domain
MVKNAFASYSVTDPDPGPDTNQRAQNVELECFAIAGTLWDQSVARFEGVCQEQLHCFAAVRWPGMNIEPLIFRRNGKIVGGALVLTKPLPAGLGGFAVIKWGPFLAEGDARDARANYRAMANELVARYAHAKGLFLTVLPRAVPERENPASALLCELGFFPGSSLPYPNRYFVRVGLNEADLKASFGQKWRYHLKKSHQNGLTFAQSDVADLPIFNSLYSSMTDRKRFADYSAFSTLDQLFSNAGERLRPALFFVRHEGRPVAGAVVFTAGKTAVYLYGATSNEALPLRAGYFIQGEIIRWLGKNTKADWYDLGGTDGYDGLHRFKSGMTGKAGAIQPVPPVMHFAPNRWSRFLGLNIYRVRDFRANLTRLIHSARAGR